MARRKKADDEALKKYEALTQIEAARLLGVHRTTLGNSQAPRNHDGTYNLPAVIRWAFCFGWWRSEAARDDILRHIVEGGR